MSGQSGAGFSAVLIHRLVFWDAAVVSGNRQCWSREAFSFCVWPAGGSAGGSSFLELDPGDLACGGPAHGGPGAVSALPQQRWLAGGAADRIAAVQSRRQGAGRIFGGHL